MNNLPRTPVVYLAGGMKSDWQDRVMALVPGPLYIDPRTHRLADERDYTQWDLTGVALCDIVFACLEKDNPSGYGLCVELGAAAALGKTIIYVEEPGFERSKYMGMARQVSTSRHSDLTSGAMRLEGLVFQFGRAPS